MGSSRIVGARLSRKTIRSGSLKCGDNWSITWADDNHQYTSYGDGRGWLPNESRRYNTRVERIVGGPDHLKAEFLPDFPPFALKQYHWYGYGIICVKGILYHFIGYLERLQGFKRRRFRGARLVYSKDHGVTWFRHDGKAAHCDRYKANPDTMFFWDEPDHAFAQVSFLQYGQNNLLAKDKYAYLYAPNGYNDMEHTVLARVPVNRILERKAYRYFVELDERGIPVWSRDIRQRGPVCAFPPGWVGEAFPYSWHPHVVYNPGLKCYVMVASGTGKSGKTHMLPACLTVCVADRPWGPWRQIHFKQKWTSGDPGDRLYEPVLSPKWISPDGRIMALIFSDMRDNFTTNYLFNIQKMTLTLR